MLVKALTDKRVVKALKECSTSKNKVVPFKLNNLQHANLEKGSQSHSPVLVTPQRTPETHYTPAKKVPIHVQIGREINTTPIGSPQEQVRSATDDNTRLPSMELNYDNKDEIPKNVLNQSQLHVSVITIDCEYTYLMFYRTFSCVVFLSAYKCVCEFLHYLFLAYIFHISILLCGCASTRYFIKMSQ